MRSKYGNILLVYRVTGPTSSWLRILDMEGKSRDIASNREGGVASLRNMVPYLVTVGPAVAHNRHRSAMAQRTAQSVQFRNFLRWAACPRTPMPVWRAQNVGAGHSPRVRQRHPPTLMRRHSPTMAQKLRLGPTHLPLKPQHPAPQRLKPQHSTAQHPTLTRPLQQPTS